MSLSDTPTYTVFVGDRRLGGGDLQEAARVAKQAEDAGDLSPLVFDDATGRILELDLRGSQADVLDRLSAQASQRRAPVGRGRPRLGVTAREVTLLPGHWEWLASQPGGASAALRRLVDQARRAGAGRAREAQEAAHRIMFALAGDAPQFEEATRAIYAGEYERFATLTEAWPHDVAQYVRSFVRRIADAEAAGES